MKLCHIAIISPGNCVILQVFHAYIEKFLHGEIIARMEMK